MPDPQQHPPKTQQAPRKHNTTTLPLQASLLARQMPRSRSASARRATPTLTLLLLLVLLLLRPCLLLQSITSLHLLFHLPFPLHFPLSFLPFSFLSISRFSLAVLPRHPLQLDFPLLLPLALLGSQLLSKQPAAPADSTSRRAVVWARGSGRD